MENPVERLMRLIPDGVDGALIQTPVNRRYLTGFKSSAGFVLLLKGACIFLTDFRYYESAQKVVKTARVEQYTRLADTFAALKKKYNLRYLLVEHDRLCLGDLERMQTAFEGVKLIYDTKLDEILSDIRIVKTPEELRKIEQAQALTEKAYDHILHKIRPGVTEISIALEIEYFMRRQGAEAVAFDPIVVSGRNSALPHGVPTGKAIETGDFVTMDTGAMVDGWHSDMTRTVAVGRVTEEQRKMYEVVRRAQCCALERIRAGLSCEDADEAARQVIREAGYGEAFGHSTGHGVGMEVHEAPSVAPGNPQLLRPGMVITVEPGIYLSGKFGVRIEDMVIVTEVGHKNLTKCTKDLTIL